MIKTAALFLIATFFLILPVLAQTKPGIATGKSAAKAFVFEGKPLHPFCLDFPLERSSRNSPIELAKCTDRKVAPKKEGDGWWSAEYPREEGAFFLSFPPGISYGVLAKKGDRFLVATEHSGGGSGQFTDLFWVRLDDKQVVVIKDERGGDRCAGRLDGYQFDESAIRFHQATPAADIVGLAGVMLDEATKGKLRYAYSACDGEAYYCYDLVSEKTELTSLTLNETAPDTEAEPNDPQVCFDKLVQQYAKAKKTNLKPDKLKEFGQKFAAACVKPNTPAR